MLSYHRFLSRITAPSLALAFSPRRISVAQSTDDVILDITTDVEESRSPKAPKALSSLNINEGGNINRADILGTVTELKLLDRLSQPEKQWATLFVRTRIPVHLTSDEDAEPVSTRDDDDDVEQERGFIGFQVRTYHNRVHVFDRRLLPLVKRLRPGDRVFVTGFLSYYKPTGTYSSPELVKVRKIGAVVAERLILLGSSDTEKAEPSTSDL